MNTSQPLDPQGGCIVVFSKGADVATLLAKISSLKGVKLVEPSDVAVDYAQARAKFAMSLDTAKEIVDFARDKISQL